MRSSFEIGTILTLCILGLSVLWNLSAYFLFQVKISDTNYLTVEMDLAGHLVELDIAVEQQ